mmetsp:Transcript_22923/g.33287  ORF Transcript_22923/g.33287 Transcript_22923/m.33287 type:complete len:248 (-) Transcript_22923:189-932(-)
MSNLFRNTTRPFLRLQQTKTTSTCRAFASKASRASKTKNHAKGTRIIVTTDIPDHNGGMYKHEVHTVKSGFARNYLIPEKLALYATPANFERLGVKDPDVETVEERRLRQEEEERLAKESSEGGGEDAKAADFLSYYLRNKVLKIHRNVDPSTNLVFPGLVNATNIRQKLSKQLKIDLDDDELIHISATPVIHSELTEEDTEKIMKKLNESVGNDCGVTLKVLGEYVARITLSGDYAVPLKFAVLKR